VTLGVIRKQGEVIQITLANLTIKRLKRVIPVRHKIKNK
jgi:hypothetical protein